MPSASRTDPPRAAELVNLRQARKRKLRAERQREAEINRFEHGRSREEKALAARLNRKAAEDLEARRLEGARRADGPQGIGPGPGPNGQPDPEPTSGH
ncbi:MAG: DUF4169 family protein [Pararhizobium sp.]